jgi:predicted hotdog family 3-hydroxylacyl-ACP dehydratase
MSELPALRELVPHRAPMLLLDELVAFDERSATCALTIREDSIFAQDGRVPAWAALEYCAQCIAVYAGLRARAKGQLPSVGLLVAAREMTLEIDAFEQGDRLLVDARWDYGEARVGRFDCAVRRLEAVVVKASITVYQLEDRDDGAG